MSYRLNSDWRGNRNYQIGSFPPAFGTMHYSIASYCTDKTLHEFSNDNKSQLNETLTSESYLTQLQRLSNPLQKNLADTLPNLKVDTNKNMTANYRHSRQKSFDFSLQETKRSVADENRGEHSTFLGIGNFISNVFNVISQAMPFQKRERRSTVVNLNEFDAPRDDSPPLVTWPKSNLDIQNKNKTQSQTHNHTIEINEVHNTKMNKECLSAASQCEGKLATVRLLLANKVAATKPVPVKARRPRRIFVPPSSVEDVFEDAFSPEDCEHLSSTHDIEHVSPTKNVVQHYVKLNCPKVEIKVAFDTTDIDKPSQSKNNEVEPIDSEKKQDNKEIYQETSSDLTIDEIANPVIELNNDVLTSNESFTDYPLTPENSQSINIVAIEEPVVNLKSDISTSCHAKNNIELKLEEESDGLKSQIVTSCEDKVNRLKAMLLERKLNSKSTKHNITNCNKEEESIGGTDKETHHDPYKKHKGHSKKHKNPNRCTNKRPKYNQNRIIKEDMTFANEINSDIPSSLENSPQSYEINKRCVENCAINLPSLKPSINGDIAADFGKTLTPQDSPDVCGFDEVSGRFRNSSTTESEDSFQIVFTDNLKPTSRSRKLSDCDSEDSFIVFEDSPDSCYTSTDIFGNSDEDTESSSSDYESDSGNEICKLNHAFSRTVSDLTDTSLYEPGGFPEGPVCLDSEDEVDSAVKLGEVLDSGLLKDSVVVDDAEVVCDEVLVPKKTGLLLTDEKKLQKRLEGPRKVRFSEAPPKVHVMRVWQFAARQARAGHWERHALDRERFQRRIADVDMAISWVLKPQHRSRVKFQRFMPWWHAQRRKEAAEKKLREEQERIQKEEDERKRKEEEELRKEEEERMRIEEAKRIEEEKERAEKESSEGKTATDNGNDKSDLLVINSKCLLHIESINEIKRQISDEIKQLLASNEPSSSDANLNKRKLTNVKKDKSLMNKKSTTVANKIERVSDKDDTVSNKNYIVLNKNATFLNKNDAVLNKNETTLNKNATFLNKSDANLNKNETVLNTNNPNIDEKASTVLDNGQNSSNTNG